MRLLVGTGLENWCPKFWPITSMPSKGWFYNWCVTLIAAYDKNWIGHIRPCVRLGRWRWLTSPRWWWSVFTRKVGGVVMTENRNKPELALERIIKVWREPPCPIGPVKVVKLVVSSWLCASFYFFFQFCRECFYFLFMFPVCSIGSL